MSREALTFLISIVIITFMVKIDLIGRTFGNLTVLSFALRNRWGGSTWLCKCLCGKETIVTGGHLTKGVTKSCGCKRGLKLNKYHNNRLIDITGKKYGLLTVVNQHLNPNKNETLWVCKCDCGNQIMAASHSLR